ncbi:uncharacterized protein si:ch211-250c4.3 [Melanotaenia boesemani]|uniref:uncharacterized protein si:ch211-250c4.3 n=1 Tax=Melanotaenia boesemani TaxID=1250792 RepID=UPI001C03AF36|nr:uncharacterized protein si:ch211-250c4.3 [Melanotaenia boesemani]
MSMKKKKGLVISWHKSMSILAPWRKGKGDRDAFLEREVVLTKLKLFNNFHEKLLTADDSLSTVSTVSVSDQDILDPPKASKVNSHLEDKPGQPGMESGSDYLSAIFSHSQLPRLYKFESEDSGVELPSGANSPSTPMGSEQSFVVHSRESSCDSCHLNPDHTSLPNILGLNISSSETQQQKDSQDPSLNAAVDTPDDVFLHRDKLGSPAGMVELDMDQDTDQNKASESLPEGDGEKSEQCEESVSLPESICMESMTPAEESSSGTGTESMRRSDSLEEYMDQCCRLSQEQQQSPSPLGSGLGYLQHICQLIEKIGHLQEINLRLQRQICSLQKDGRMTKTKEDFFQQHCSCGAANISFQEIQKRRCRGDFLSLSGTLSDLSTIPEVSRHPLMSPSRGMSSESLTPLPLWRRSMNRRSYTEGEARFLGDVEGLSIPQRRLSENYTWGRVKDLMRKSKVRNQNRLGLISTSLKMSCPQLYRPDLELAEQVGRNRNSMIALGHQSKLDLSWLQ